MKLVVTDKRDKLLTIDLNEAIQKEVNRLKFELANGHINQKQFKLKILSTVLRSEAG